MIAMHSLSVTIFFALLYVIGDGSEESFNIHGSYTQFPAFRIVRKIIETLQFRSVSSVLKMSRYDDGMTMFPTFYVQSICKANACIGLYWQSHFTVQSLLSYLLHFPLFSLDDTGLCLENISSQELNWHVKGQGSQCQAVQTFRDKSNTVVNPN